MTHEEMREYVALRDGGARAMWQYDPYRHEHTCRIGGRIFVSNDLPHHTEMSADFRRYMREAEREAAQEANSKLMQYWKNAQEAVVAATKPAPAPALPCHKLGAPESRRLFEPMFDSAGARLYRARHTPNALWLLTSLVFIAVGVLAL